jgi:subfamily B ATP-binding cassette protein MsbA
MFWIDWVVTLIALVVLPVVIPSIIRLGKKLRRTAMSTQEQTAAMASMVSESLGSVRVAKVYGLETYLKGRAAGLFDQIRRLKMKAANQRARLDPILEIGGGMAVAGVLVFIGWRIVKGQTTIGDFTGFITAMLLAAQSFRTLGNLNAILQEAIASLQRVFALMDEKPAVVDRPGAGSLAVADGTITFESVGFRYHDGEDTLRSIALEVKGGTMTALVGRSGSGKSTLMSLVPRLYDPTEGRVIIDGQDKTFRDRITCFRQAEPLMQPGSIILVDDFWRYEELLISNSAQSVKVFESVGPCRIGVTSTAMFFY